MSLPSTIKQWETAQDGLANLKLTTAPIPTPGANEVLVKINSVSLNYRDTEVVMGLYNHHKTTGNATAALVPCSDMCGTIVTSNSTSWKEGDKVISIFNQTHLKGQIQAEHMKHGLGLPLPGVLTEYRVFPEYGLVKAPEYLSSREASTLPIAGMTAWMAINGMRPLGQPGGKGESVLIQGTGGVAINGLQIAKASGAEVIITSSSDAKLERAKAMGADHTINYRTTPEWHEEVMKITNGRGVDIIFENGGALTLRKSFSCIAFGGLIDCIGYLSGKEDAPEDRLNTNVLALMRNVTLKGLLNGPRERLEEMLAFYESNNIKPVIDKVFEFTEAREALEYLFKGGHFGKVVVKISE
ncbi:NAD(P)-binding protein-25 [Coleophoma crateriformis]|uniref:NAD(P)-binding protein-25 n=1 Tax=Coleophoma crateriformis TaxID=565419 RepID=A0A3D8T708_9HELO|nr:NAD(P)-binding protein-25 [Coleophoma crateriformis]